jgi:hypothetical protein
MKFTFEPPDEAFQAEGRICFDKNLDHDPAILVARPDSLEEAGRAKATHERRGVSSWFNRITEQVGFSSTGKLTHDFS